MDTTCQYANNCPTPPSPPLHHTNIPFAPGSLPFTGAEISLYMIIGLMIIMSGLALRHYSARRNG